MIVVDTHVLLWMDRDDQSLGPASRRLIENEWERDGVGVSAISFWEIAMLEQRGRILLPVPPETWRRDILTAGIVEIPVTGDIALHAAALESFHKDPADRFIVATAALSDAILVTADTAILHWPSSLRRLDARR